VFAEEVVADSSALLWPAPSVVVVVPERNRIRRRTGWKYILQHHPSRSNACNAIIDRMEIMGMERRRTSEAPRLGIKHKRELRVFVWYNNAGTSDEGPRQPLHADARTVFTIVCLPR